MKAKRSTVDLVNTYLREVIDRAAKVNTPTFDRLAMSADALRAKASELDGPGSSLAESMGAGSESASQTASDSVAEGVLRRSAQALKTFREDIDPRTVGVGLDAAARLLRERARTGRVSPSFALVGSGFFTDPIDGRQHDHFLAPPKYSPPRGWPCCADLPGQRPTSWHADDLSDLVTGTADYPIEAYDLTPDELAVLHLLEAEHAGPSNA